MKTLIRSFKRHYHKVKQVHKSLVPSGSIKLELKVHPSGITAQNIIADEELTTRFIVLMGRFLNPNDSLYYKSFWNRILKNFIKELPDKTIDEISKAINSLKKGGFVLRIGNRNLTPEYAYQLISKGFYFAQDPESNKILQRLSQARIMQPLLWNQFYGFAVQAYYVVSAIFSAILEIENCQTFQQRYGNHEASPMHCIYCLKRYGPFTSEEHIFPESLGNDEMILPPGYVCDTCNHGILAELDDYLLKFEPIAFLSTFFVPYTKQGKLPQANFQNLAMSKNRPREIQVFSKDRTGQVQKTIDLGGGVVSFKFNIVGNPFNHKRLARSFYKIALGTVAYKQGHKRAISNTFDDARAFILGAEGFPNNILLRMTSIPNPHVQIFYHDLKTGTPFVISIFGVTLMLNLEDMPRLEVNEELSQQQFQAFSLFPSEEQ